MGRKKDFSSDEYIKDRIKSFYSKIKIDENDCWLWIGSTNQKYGVIRFKNTNLGVHRFCFEYIKKEKIGDKFVCHSCDKPLCVNPEHLFLGTHSENMKDAQSKQRHAFGEKHYQNKLKDRDVEEIRKLVKCGLSQNQIAKMFEVEQTNISLILRGKNWKYSEITKYDAEILIQCCKTLFGELGVYKLLKFYDLVKDIYKCLPI